MKRIKIYMCIFIVILIIACIGAGLGAILVTLSERYPEYFTIGIVRFLLVFSVALILSVWLHELAHMLAFKWNKIGIRVFYACPFCIVKDENGTKIRFIMNAQIGVGGVVIPQLPLVNNEAEFQELKKKFAKALKAGPIFSAFMGLVSLLFVIFCTEAIPMKFRVYLFFFLGAMFLVAVYINVTSLLNMGSIVGDYAGARGMLKDDAYALLQFYNYYLLQKNEVKKHLREGNSWFLNELLSFVRGKMVEEPFDSTNLLLVDAVLYEALFTRDETFNDGASEIAEVLEKNIEICSQRLQFGAYFQCFSHLIMFMSVYGERDKATALWEMYRDRIPKTEVGKYRCAQVELFLYSKRAEVLLSEKKIVISSLDSLLCKIEGYYEDEMFLNKKDEIVECCKQNSI